MSSKLGVNRRNFLGRTAVGTAGLSLALASGPFPGRVLGANDKIVMGVIGCGGQGHWDLKDMIKTGEVKVCAVCDVSRSRREEMAQFVKDAGCAMGNRVDLYNDFRKLLHRKEIDAVLVATPDHWHALPTVMACQAGKDVYVEKPLALTIYEGRKMVEAARKYDRVVQAGTQQRSGPHFQQAIQLVRNGRIGKVSFIRTWNYGNRYPKGIGNPPDCDPPEDLDWNFWLGPAPRKPYNPNRCFYKFRWFWDYSGGQLTDWGTHLIDIAQWAMDVEYPKSACATGGRYYLQDNGETPDTLTVVYEYDGSDGPFQLEYQNRDCNARRIHDEGYGTEFHGTDGTLFVNRGGFELIPETRKEGDKKVNRTEAAKGKGTPQHFPHVKNFLECVRTRKRPICDVEICYRSTSTPLLGNISLHVGRKIYWDGEKERILHDREASRLLKKKYRKPWKLSMLNV